MSVPRVVSHGRSFLSRGFTTSRATSSILRTVSTATSRRQFSSSIRFQQEIIETPATGSEVPLTATRNASPANNAQSIGIMKLPKRTVKADIEQLLRSAGVDAKRIQFRVDRFTFFSDSSCFVELGSEEQAQKAIEVLNGQQVHGNSVVVRPVKGSFYWDQGFKKDQRFFFHDENTPSQAIQPLIEGRRYVLHVESPGWLKKGSDKSVNTTIREIIKKHFEPFGLEVIGALNPAWRDHKKERMFLTHIDFASKEGAEQAVGALDEKEVEGRQVWLKPCTFHPLRTEQIGNVDKGVLAQLHESGFIPPRPTKAPSEESVA